MTALGKILVFVNLVFSLIVAGLIVVVYIARTNWAAGYADYQKSYQAADASLKATQAEAQEAQRNLAKRIQELQGQAAAAQTALETEKAAKAAADRAVEEERKKGTGESATVAALKADVERRDKEVRNLEEAVKQKDDQITKLVKSNNDLRDQKVAADITANTMKERLEQAARQNEELSRQLAQGRRGGGAGDGGARDNPPQQNVEGLVKQTDPSGLVVISIGSDAGLARGHTLDVYRYTPSPLYLGQIRLTDVQPNQAVGRPVSRMRSSPQVGDRVAGNLYTRG